MRSLLLILHGQESLEWLAWLVAAGGLMRNTAEFFRSDLSMSYDEDVAEQSSSQCSSALHFPASPTALLQRTPEQLWQELPKGQPVLVPEGQGVASGCLPKDKMPICLYSSMRDRHGNFSPLTGPSVDQRENVCSEVGSASGTLSKNRPEIRKGEAEGKNAAITFLMKSSSDIDGHSVDTPLSRSVCHTKGRGRWQAYKSEMQAQWSAD